MSSSDSTIAESHAQEAGAADAAGLVNAHITAGTPIERLRNLGRTAQGYAVVLPGGLRVGRHTAGPDPAQYHGGGKRGDVCGMSGDSHRRMMGTLQALDWQAGPVHFVTLTWHDGFTGDWETWKKALRAWQARLAYHYPGRVAGVLWKLELKERKSGALKGVLAPHYHLALFWRKGKAPGLAAFRAWVASSWNAVAEPGDAQHLAAGTNVLKARNTSGPEMGRLLAYLSKYLGKMGAFALQDADGQPMQTGRIWGVCGEPPEGACYGVTLDWQAYQDLIARVNAWGEQTGSWYQRAVSENWVSFALYGDGALLAERLLSPHD